MQHSLVVPGDNHAPHQWVFANQAARLAAAISNPSEINKLALQLSDGSYWRLVSVAPATWQVVGGGGGGPSYVLVYGEVPAGAIDGANVTFALASAPDVPASLALYVQYVANGAWLRLMRGFDFALAGAVITMNVAPNVGAHMLADYRTLP